MYRDYSIANLSSFGYSVVMKVGDTAKDAQEGLNVGALTIITLEGTQTREQLERTAGMPNYFVNKTRDILQLINDKQIVLQPYK